MMEDRLGVMRRKSRQVGLRWSLAAQVEKKECKRDERFGRKVRLKSLQVGLRKPLAAQVEKREPSG